ncbi:response regulator [Flavobacterium degerlachei]|jgi:CheY-like chemotaxis protein|uniref:Response regulator receiver domain-containing protein n=1 Tax=Flavobacterium degerlachei TaxID=229203 RepID=A0A1H3BUH0_9FLAO|nr:response regulator [Flavobacterium degerlachei]SDX45670.1 Response regulator receiver domain-containing protein [Flavobacterium degerlachei]
MTKKNIWVIDDDPIYQILIDKIIKKAEVFSSFSSFKNGEEAINALNDSLKNMDSLPDLILLDINMPVMNGWEFMEAFALIKSLIEKPISVYIVSSSIAVEDKNKSKTYPNILGYLSKPISINDLLLIASND